METFNYIVQASPVKNLKPNVSVVKFGDGYEQRIRKGINTNPQVWDVSFLNRTKLEGDEIDAFFERHGGAIAFLWIPPFQEVAIKVVCESWSFTPRNGLTSLATQFRQVFDP